MKTMINLKTKLSFVLITAFFMCILLNSTVKVFAQPQIAYTSLAQHFSAPVNIANAADGSGRLFIVEQGGLVKISRKGTILDKPFIDLTAIVSYKNFKGLWAIAFAPDYIKNRTFFVLYDDSKRNATIVARYKASKTNPDSADMKSGVTLLALPERGGLGDMHFGKDGDLYISLDDGSFDTSTTNSSQNLGSYFGKILRIDVNVPTPPYYRIPPTNPYINKPNALPEIFAYGIRNAWRWSFDRLTNNMWLADVGGEQWEELNVQTPQQFGGYNYGWPCYEANVSFISSDCNNTSKYVFPAFSYPHDSSFGGQTIIGGYVYRGNSYPALRGYYICSDEVTNNAWKILPNGTGGLNVYLQSNVPPGIVSYGEDENGELYAVSYDGHLYNIGLAGDTIVSTSTQYNAIDVKSGETKIYPTLVTNNTLTVDMAAGFKNFSLYNASGSKVFSRQLSEVSESIRVMLPALAPGIYFVHLSGTHFYQQKIYITK